MKLTIPEELRNSFDMLMKSVPKELQDDDELKDTALVYLKVGGMSLARNYIKITKKYLNNDPLDTGVGVRFPKIVEPKAEDSQQDENSDADENDEEDEGDEAGEETLKDDQE
jgi:hypothetical protein